MFKALVLFLSRLFWPLACLIAFVPASFAQEAAEQIFASIEPAVFQIQIIEKKSASQVALGTGFLVQGNRIATNYHVVSDVVLEPKKHRIQIRYGNTWVKLNVITVDVVNDLALLQPDEIQVFGAAAADYVSAKPGLLSGVQTAEGATSKVVPEPAEREPKLEPNNPKFNTPRPVTYPTETSNTSHSMDSGPKGVVIVAKPFVLATTSANQGSLLYSLGNPHNIGMTVVQGNYNGFAEHSFLKRIHFSGAVNSGMSGGPAVNASAQVVGINVASAGNQIGFLVPVAYLAALMQKASSLSPDYNLLKDMAAQIGAHTDAMVSDLLSHDWPTESMAGATILGKVVDWMDCWGDSEDNPETGINQIARGCRNADKIYISGRLDTSFFEYEYFYNEMPRWPVSAFYRYWARDTSAAAPGNRASKKHVKNYKCANHTLATHTNSPQAITRRASYCIRPYKKLPGLFDVFFIGVSADKSRKGVMDHFTLAGVTEASAEAFLAKFVGVLAWQ